MQPKVSSALLKYVKPVATSELASTGGKATQREATSNGQNSGQRHDRQEPSGETFQRAQPPKIPLETTPEAAPDNPQATKNSGRAGKKIPAGVTNAFLHLFQKFHFQRETLTRWLVRDQYENAAQQKTSGKVKKGSVLDKKTES